MGMVNQDGSAIGIAAGTLIDGRYKIVRPIGQGGNGMVHEVEHLMTGRRLALKSLLDETGLARLEQEARASALMKNGHAVKITDMGKEGPAGPYLVMELLDGQSLRELLDEAGQLPLELTVNVIVQICECLSEAHSLGIIHRDLKPENVFLCASPWPGQYDVKVLDFGIVKIADSGAIPKSSLTRTGSTVGTPYYMSLEQLRNSSAVDARADIYALGVVLYESLSGRKPFQAETIGDLVYALCSGPPTQLGRLRPDLPSDVCDVVMRTLSVNRDERPATMTDLASALLPHGSAAFGMWIRADARGSGPSGARALASVSPSPVRAPLPSTTQVPAPVFRAGYDAPVETSALPMLPAEAVRTSPLGFPGAPAPSDPPETSKWPMAESAESAARPGRRDTPTEMFVKDMHGARPEENQPAAPDRDTPTRAFRTDMGDFGRSQTPAPQGAFPSNEGGAGGPQGSPINLVATGMGLPQVPVGPLRGSGIPAPTFGGAATPAPQASAAPNRPPGAPAKPAWQVSLDASLRRFELFMEETVRKLRTAPQSTQIALIIAAGGAMLLLLSLFLLVLLH